MSLSSNSLAFCKECIDKFFSEKINSPIYKIKYEYIKNGKIEKSLNNLYFKCFYQKEGCGKIMKYLDYLNHINNCEFTKYICKVDKFNYFNKNFEKCNFMGNNKKLINILNYVDFIDINANFVMKIFFI